MYKPLSEDHLYVSYKTYEVHIARAVKDGRMSSETAYRLLNDAKKNYRNQNYNRQVEIINRKRS